MEFFKNQVVACICDAVKLDTNIVSEMIETPPSYDLGDFAFPCFRLSNILHKAPNIIAEELARGISLPECIERAENVSAYVNFYINKPMLTNYIINEISAKKDSYGSSMRGNGKSALVEHTSINPNASPHVGRARNALIGDFIVRLLRFEGYKVDVHYFVNDIGKQIAMLLLGAKQKKNINFSDLLNIYVEINNRVKQNPELEKQVFELLYKLENGDREIISGFRDIVNVCVEGQAKILGKLGIKYDSYDYESLYIWNKTIDEVLQQLKRTGRLFEDEEGRYVLNLEEFNLPFLVVTRADKTSLYPLRDIAYTIDKVRTNSDKNIVVLGEDQKLYFQQVKAAVNLLGYQAPEVVHYSFVLLTDGKMSTREGTVVLLEDLMNEAVLKAKAEIQKRHDTVNEAAAESIAYGAVKYAMFKASNDKNVVFDWDSALNFEGDSSPYIQYSYARISSILRKYEGELPTQINAELLNSTVEYQLVKQLADFTSAINRAVDQLSPHIIANYVYNLTKQFSVFYHECPVLNAHSQDLIMARLVLISCVRQVIKNCLNIMGIKELEKM